MSRKLCTIYETYCHKHDFAHGAEAEELRHGIERLISLGENYSVGGLRAALQRLLDSVDARDSLAYLEAQDTPKEEAVSTRERAAAVVDAWKREHGDAPQIECMPGRITAAIEAAVQEEREACAREADAPASYYRTLYEKQGIPFGFHMDTAEKIAAAIRRRGAP